MGVLGAGTFGFVLAARVKGDLQGREVACKFVEILGSDPNRWVQDMQDERIMAYAPFEVHVLSRLNHPNIVRLVDYYENVAGCSVMVTELHGIEW